MALVAVAVLGMAMTVFMRRTKAVMSEKDSILVTDFVNTTADPMFDGTLKKALAVDLEQSPYRKSSPSRRRDKLCSSWGERRMNASLAMWGAKSASAPHQGHPERLYRESWQPIRDHAGRSERGIGESLAREEVQAENKETVLNSLHQAGSSLRKKLGESLASVQKYDKPLSEATTSSLEALKAFSLGDSKHMMFNELAALPLYQRAVELDPNFAMAYARLGTVYNNLGQSELAEKNREKAFELRDRASEHEKLYIMSHYYVDSGQLEKGITALDLYKQTYPRDSTPYNNLAVLYNEIGEYKNELDNARQSVQLEPDSASGYSNVGFADAGLNRLDEAKATFNHALERKTGSSIAHSSLAIIAWLQGDNNTLKHEFDAMKDDPQGEFEVTGLRSAMAAYAGQVKAGRALGQKRESG